MLFIDTYVDVLTAGLPVSYKFGPRWHFCCQGPILNPRPVLDSSAQTTRGMLLDFFCKTSKWPRLTSRRVGGAFQGFLGTKLAL